MTIWGQPFWRTTGLWCRRVETARCGFGIWRPKRTRSWAFGRGPREPQIPLEHQVMRSVDRDGHARKLRSLALVDRQDIGGGAKLATPVVGKAQPRDDSTSGLCSRENVRSRRWQLSPLPRQECPRPLFRLRPTRCRLSCMCSGQQERLESSVWRKDHLESPVTEKQLTEHGIQSQRPFQSGSQQASAATGPPGLGRSRRRGGGRVPSIGSCWR